MNTEAGERFSSVSPDGKIMFFMRDFGKRNGDSYRVYYWIDAGFINELKPIELIIGVLMKQKFIFIGSAILLVLIFSNCTRQSGFPKLKGPYLGQKPPGMTPEVFAPGLVSTKDHQEFSCTFSPDGKEFYFNRGMTIMVCRKEKDRWTNPEPVKFTEGYRSHEPHIPMDNKRLYYGSMREQPPGYPVEEYQYGIWMTERTEQGWGTPRYVGYGMYVTTTQDGTIYLTDISDSPEEIIARTSLMDGKFTDLIRQKGGVIAPAPDRIPGRHPGIAPDESFILFDAYKKETKNDGKLFICFRVGEDTWGEAIDLGEVIGYEKSMVPYISPDGRYLFFTANSDIYWVDAKIIEMLRPII